MDDGEVDLSSQLLLPNSEISRSFDDFLRNTRTCTHTHTCNPPGPAAALHTHTCYHTHIQVLETADGERERELELKKSQRPLGNRDAVRKYREKKKAHAAYLEEEVKKLRLANQQLLRRLQGQAILEAEVVRLRSLLVDLRGKIDAELTGFPFRQQYNVGGLHSDIGGRCISGNLEVVGWEGSCVPAVVDREARQNFDMAEAANSMDVVGSLISSASPGKLNYISAMERSPDEEFIMRDAHHSHGCLSG